MNLMKRRLLNFVITIGIMLCFKHMLHGNPSMRDVVKGYDILLIFSFLIITYFVVSSITNKIVIYKKTESWFNVFLVIGSFLLLCIPLTKINTSDISTSENRKLNVFPSLLVNNIFNYNYGKQFDSWLNDHFRGREKALKYNYRIESFLAGRVENEKAFEGKDGWLFYKGDNSIANFQNLNNFTDDELLTIKNKLEEKRDFCAVLGAHYNVVIAPDKNKVYGEYYPEYYHKVNEIGRGEQLYRYLQKNSDLKVIYPLDKLLATKDIYELYYKNDTHWNSMGAFIGYEQLIKMLKADYPDLKAFQLNDFVIGEKAVDGDLQNMLNLKNRTYTTITLDFKGKPTYKLQNKAPKTENIDAGTSYIITDSSKKYNVIIFRDSFCTVLQPILSEQFGHVEYLWTRNFFGNLKLLQEKKPDIVIDEAVERYAQGLVN